MTTLLIADHDNVALREGTARALTAARAFGAPVHVLVAGNDAGGVAAAVAALEGVEKVLHADAPVYAHGLAEPLAALILEIAKDYTAVVAPSSSAGKNVLPRVAALLDVMQVSDITKVVAADTFERPIYAGNAVETVQATDAVKVVTVRAAAFPPTGAGGNAQVVAVEPQADPGLSRFKNEETARNGRPDLAAARVVVAGGRALASADAFAQVLGPLADKLGAAIGATRAAVDDGFIANDLQVGQTGKVVAPELYIAVGISGAIQHLAGMRDSKIIVAINNDAEAPIFQVADYGLVGDLFTVLPALVQELNGPG